MLIFYNHFFKQLLLLAFLLVIPAYSLKAQYSDKQEFEVEKRLIGKWYIFDIIQNGNSAVAQSLPVRKGKTTVIQFEPDGKAGLWEDLKGNDRLIGKMQNLRWKVIHSVIIFTHENGNVAKFHFFIEEKKMYLISDPANGEIWIKFDDALY